MASGDFVLGYSIDTNTIFRLNFNIIFFSSFKKKDKIKKINVTSQSQSRKNSGVLDFRKSFRFFPKDEKKIFS